MNKYILLLFLAFLFTSCKKDFYNFSFSERKKLQIEEVDFDYFSGRSKIKYLDDNQSMNANASIRIKNDSIIWFSVTPGLGIEMLRVIILHDSIHVMDRMHKSYYSIGFDSLSTKLNFKIDYNMLEAILFGNLIQERSKNDRIDKDENYYILAQKNEGLQIDNYINSKSMKIEKVHIEEDPTKNQLAIYYHNFQILDTAYIFPFDYSFNLLYNGQNSSVNTQVNISYNKAAISKKKLRFPFNVPNKYESN
ncbi:DUF4292 domain-containing protein [Bacteroidota bacterium]